MQELKLPKLVRNFIRMFEAIPAFAMEKRIAASRMWRERAAQARRIGIMLSLSDASVLEAYALECEAAAASLVAPQPAPIAA
jgi:hypothetical protein